MRQLIREGKSASKALQAQIDRAVALADREIGIRRLGIRHSGTALPVPITNSPLAQSRRQPVLDSRPTHHLGGLPVAPTHAIPPTPPPEPISVADYTERIRAGWVPVMGLPGTPITSGFVRDLGEYNPKLEGLNGIWTYQEMRRGDGQVAGTLRACKLPILSAKWEIVPGDSGDSGHGTRDTGTRRFAIASRQSPLVTVSSTGAGQPTADKAKEVADFIRANLFSGLEWQDSRGSWHTQDWKDVVRCALRMQDFGAACYEEVMAIDGDRIRVRRMCDRQALTFYRWHTDPHTVDPSLPPFVYDDGETLYALEQWGYRSNRFEYVLLPTDKACIFTHDQEGANFWGIPLTRAMYPHWFVKKHLERIDAIACERNSLGVPMIMLPPNPSQAGRADRAELGDAVGRARKDRPLAAQRRGVQAGGHRGTHSRNPALASSTTSSKSPPRASPCLWSSAKPQTGSRALGESQTDFFLLATQNTADYIAHQIRNSTIRRLVHVEFRPRRAGALPRSRQRAGAVDRYHGRHHQPARPGGSVDFRPLEREPGAARTGLQRLRGRRRGRHPRRNHRHARRADQRQRRRADRDRCRNHRAHPSRHS